ncbi:hypothetical protein B0T17DRAFT_616107 [Bombardia bombarda]|uniref:Transaldolase n=1 Tax=Bombardia bombarda TaxID=252184 RepID=A0AA40C9V4_9PEZI|nr:hypothetical protein B0T17DRAFT_616107 [Bombardia bombarda]
MTSLLDQLRTLSVVDADTLDVAVAEKFGPFSDCTCNQAIAYGELSKLGPDGKLFNEQLILDSIKTAHWMFSKQSDATLEELAVELMTVALSLRFAPYLTGTFHVQTNPKFAFSTKKTAKNAERIYAHFKQLSPGFDTSRVSIKIPSTYEGLQACRELEAKGINTLATTVFCMEQVVMAVDAGCKYMSPYVNELRVHFDPDFIDEKKAFEVCGEAQRYVEARGANLKLLPASVTTIQEVMELAGAHHLTLAPAMLTELAATPADSYVAAATVGRIFKAPPPLDAQAVKAVKAAEAAVHDEGTWRLLFNRSGKKGRKERRRASWCRR